MFVATRTLSVTLALSLAALAAASPAQPARVIDFDASLKRAINHGVTLYNRGDALDCCRVYEGALLTVQPLLEHRPALLASVQTALASTEPPLDRAHRLRAALDQVRAELYPPARVVPGRPAAPAEALPLPKGARPEPLPLPKEDSGIRGRIEKEGKILEEKKPR